MMNLLITGAWAYTAEQIKKITDLGFNVIEAQDERAPLSVDASKIDAVICNSLFQFHDISGFTALKYIQLTSAGYDRVPLDYIKDKGMRINNARGVYSIPMAEFALCGVLDLYKERRFAEKNQTERIWKKCRKIRELYGKTVSIIGCGSIGVECAKRFEAFGCRVIGVDVEPHPRAHFESVVFIAELKNVVSESDVIVLCLPLTDKTHHIFDHDVMQCIKKGAVLVNISRGGIVDTPALIEALLTEKLYGAVIDVFEEEPLDADSMLWRMANVIVSPHQSFIGDGNSKRLFDVIYKGLKEFAEMREV